MNHEQRVRRLLALADERSYEAVMSTLELVGSFHPAASNNVWDAPLADGPPGWIVRTIAFFEPHAAPTKARVEQSLIAPFAGVSGDKGWVPETREALAELTRAFQSALGTKGEKVGSTLVFERAGAPAIRLSRARQAATKLWHVVNTEVRLLG